MRPAHVGVSEHQRPQNALVYMRLGGKIHDQVNAFRLTGGSNECLITDVTHHQLQPWGVPEVSQIFFAARVGELVVNHDSALRVLREPVTNEVAADKAAAAGDEKGLRRNGCHRSSKFKAMTAFSGSSPRCFAASAAARTARNSVRKRSGRKRSA